MNRRTFLLGMAGASVASAATMLPMTAEAATWTRIGTRQVNGLIDLDRIAVGAGAGTFKSLRFRVRGNSLMMHDMRVRYGNGGTDDFAIRFLILQGGYSRELDLNFNERFIRWVQFTYGKFPNGQGPTWIDVYGRR